MGRCPKYLNVDNFDKLAQSIGVELSDDGVSAVGEVCEFIALQIIRLGSKKGNTKIVEFDNVISVCESLGISLEINSDTKTVTNAVVER